MSGHALAVGAAAISAGLLGGGLFAFSSFVMPALRRIPAPAGITAMQSINRQATTFAFGSLMAITVILAVGLGLDAVVRRDQPGAGWVGVGTISVLMAVVITGAVNIPRNNRLDTLDAASVEAEEYWPTFLDQWILANHLRTLFCVIAAAAYVAALAQH